MWLKSLSILKHGLGFIKNFTIIYLIVGILLMGGPGLRYTGISTADDVEVNLSGPPSPVVILTSPFLMTGSGQKAIDDDMYLHIVAWLPGNFSLVVNFVEVMNGTVENYTIIHHVEDSNYIADLELFINGTSVYSISGYVVLHRRTYYVPTEPGRGFFFEISPGDWSRMQWNQFGGVVLGALISIVWFGYRTSVIWRRKHGDRVLAGGKNIINQSGGGRGG